MLYYISIPIRMCISLCNSLYATQHRPYDEYVMMSQKNGWKLLKVLKDIYEDMQDKDN